MKSFRYSAIAYERSGPVSDMFVPHAVTLASPQQISRRGFVFVIAALLIAALPTFFLPGGTLSYFSDEEQSTGNTFAAGPLDFTVAPDHATSTLIAGQTGDTFEITVTPGAGSLPFLYTVSATTTGTAAFCAAITASGGVPLSYSGLASTISTASTASLTPWSLTLTLPSGAPGVVDGQMCTLDLTYQGYQQGGTPGTEYHDTENVTLILTADPPVIVPATQVDPLSNLNQNSGDTPPADASSTDATSTNPISPSEASTTEDVESSTPNVASSTPTDTSTAPADNPPPSDATITPPTPPADPTVDTPPADTTPTDPAPADSSTDTPPNAPAQ